MNYGRFYSFDVSAALMVKGIAVFHYRGIKNFKHEKIRGIRDKYPIYVTFSKDGISFKLNFMEKSKDNKVIHSNSLILSLPLSAHSEIKDNLTKNICAIFKTNFPNSENDKQLYHIAVKSLFNSEDDNKGITYSSLEVFGINYKAPQDRENPRLLGILRKMFLDFLYDLEHTDVFLNAPYFDRLYAALNDNFLFRSLYNKAEYYYQRKFASVPKDKSETFAYSDRDIFIADYYVEAEKRWVDSIIDPRSDAVFYMAKGWFRSPEKELDDVYQSGKLLYDTTEKNRLIQSKYVTNRCASFVSKIKYPKFDKRNKKYNKQCIDKYNDQITVTARNALEWYLQRYRFAGILKIWHGNRHFLGRCIFIVLSLLLLVSIFSRDFSTYVSSDYLHFPIGILIVMTVLRAMIYFYDPTRMGRVGGVNVYMPRLFASIITAWLTLVIGENIFKGFFDRPHVQGISILLCIITFAFVYYEIHKLNPYLSALRKIMRSFVLISIAFIYSMASGIVIMDFFGPAYLERSDTIEKFYAHNIFIHHPKYEIPQASHYTHVEFYKAIENYDKTLMDKIRASKWSLDIDIKTETQDNLLINKITSIAIGRIKNDAYLIFPDYKIKNQDQLEIKYPDLYAKHNCNNITLPYGVTLKLLSEFAKVEENGELKELYTNMVMGTLLKIRYENLRRYINKINNSEYNIVSLTEKDLAQVETTLDSQGMINSDKSWICLLNNLNNNVLYQKTLSRLHPVASKGMPSKAKIIDKTVLDASLFNTMIFQFAIISMFIGVFLQLIFTEKPRNRTHIITKSTTI